MNNVKRIISFGPLSCPFLVNMQHQEIHKVQTGIEVSTKGETPTYTAFVKKGTFDICSDPLSPIQVGDLVQGQGAVFQVDKILDQRPSRGMYPFLDFHPVWQRCEVSFHESILPFKRITVK